MFDWITVHIRYLIALLAAVELHISFNKFCQNYAFLIITKGIEATC